MSQEEFEQFRQVELGVIKKTQDRIAVYQQQANAPSVDAHKKEIFLNNVKSYENTLKFHQKKLELGHPENPEEIAEKKRIWTTYDKIIAQTIPEDGPLFFHGVKSLCYLEDIFSSGHLGYLDEEQSRSTTPPGTLDVTTRDTISTTMDFLGLSSGGFDKFMPAGCLFVIAPKDEKEKEYAKQETGSQHEIKTIDFKNNPERIVAIVSTNYNQDYIKQLAEKYGISVDKVCTFDGFIERTQQKTSALQQSLSSASRDGTPKTSITETLRKQKELGDKKEIITKKIQNDGGRK